jgi:hypothetical protein
MSNYKSVFIMKNFFLAALFFVGMLASTANATVSELPTNATFAANDNIELVGQYTTKELDRESITICNPAGIDVYINGEYVGTYTCVTITY